MCARRQERDGERKRQLQRLSSRLNRIGQRREAAYEDKLDGNLSEERWLVIDRKWSREEFQIKCEMETLGTSQEPRRDDVEATLELLKRAAELYLRQNDEERARLLRLLVWNCVWEDGKAVPIYKKPFDLVAEGLQSGTW